MAMAMELRTLRARAPLPACSDRDFHDVHPHPCRRSVVVCCRMAADYDTNLPNSIGVPIDVEVEVSGWRVGPPGRGIGGLQRLWTATCSIQVKWYARLPPWAVVAGVDGGAKTHVVFSSPKNSLSILDTASGAVQRLTFDEEESFFVSMAAGNGVLVLIRQWNRLEQTTQQVQRAFGICVCRHTGAAAPCGPWELSYAADMPLPPVNSSVSSVIDRADPDVLYTLSKNGRDGPKLLHVWSIGGRALSLKSMQWLDWPGTESPPLSPVCLHMYLQPVLGRCIALVKQYSSAPLTLLQAKRIEWDVHGEMILRQDAVSQFESGGHCQERVLHVPFRGVVVPDADKREIYLFQTRREACPTIRVAWLTVCVL